MSLGLIHRPHSNSNTATASSAGGFGSESPVSVGGGTAGSGAAIQRPLSNSNPKSAALQHSSSLGHSEDVILGGVPRQQGGGDGYGGMMVPMGAQSVGELLGMTASGSVATMQLQQMQVRRNLNARVSWSRTPTNTIAHPFPSPAG